MKNFEERYTAWLDGVMDGPEREAFEAEMPERGAAMDDAAQWKKLRGLLREVVVPEPMPHGDFANNQILTAIRSEMPAPELPSRRWFPVGRLVWSGGFLLVAAAIVAMVALPSFQQKPTKEQFLSDVVKSRASDHTPGAYTFAAPGGKGSVLWVEDAGYIPADERIK
jgi:anti-sigma factor RsiW